MFTRKPERTSVL